MQIATARYRETVSLGVVHILVLRNQLRGVPNDYASVILIQ